MEIRFRQPQGYDSAQEMHYDSKAKAAVLMEMKNYTDNQRDVIQKLRERGNYLEIKDSVLLIEPDGICVVAANPNRPSILVFGDATDAKTRNNIGKKYKAIVEDLFKDKGILYKESKTKKGKAKK
jgi:hypothetical protein